MRKIVLLTFLLSVTSIIWAQNSIEPMVKASWHQRAPFNDDCPYDFPAGCGAIAVAQILNYYKMPTHGYGRATYDNVDVDFDNLAIDWSHIQDSYPAGKYSVEDGKAVASLVYQVGAAMKTRYGANGSTVQYPTMMWGLQHYLHFSPKCRYRRRRYYSTSEWIEMLNAELQSGRPVLYRGDHTKPNASMAGHVYVIDGRDMEGRYHFNFGLANKKQDKYTDLNIINQGNGIWPGIYSVSYHHRQAMVTDFYPVDGLTEADFDPSAIALNSSVVLEGHPHAQSVCAEKEVQVKCDFYFINFTGDSCQYSIGFYHQDELKAVSDTVRHCFLTAGGKAENVKDTFGLPNHLEDGNYEMSIISRQNNNSPWIRGWDNAPNRIPVSVENNVYTFTMPNYHTLETHLYLENGEINEVEDVKADGKVLELTVCNPSDNNFEDSLRLEVTANGKTIRYNMVTSIYDGQKITYRFLVANDEIDTTKDYAAVAYYREANTGEWLQLTAESLGIRNSVSIPFDGVEIYSTGGVLLKRIAKFDIDISYQQVLSQLPKGIYIIHDKNGTRKYAKRL